MSSLALILLFALVVPPQHAPQNHSREQGKADVQRDREMFPDALNKDEAARLQDGLFDNLTCFTMRTYYFKRDDGKAPQLSGTSTCTPANAFRSHKAKRTPPKVMLVPLTTN